MGREISFLLFLWKTNLLSVMEYRASFLVQVLGMVLNNAIHFAFWILFFNRFQQVRGWELGDMFLLFGVVSIGWGVSLGFFGNVRVLADVIAGGRLDYYLSLPRPVLLHMLASRSQASGFGDIVYGFISFAAAGYLAPDALLRFVLGATFSTCVFLAFLIMVQSMAFWLGNASLLSNQAIQALLKFSLYPFHLFDGATKFILYTLVPAAFVGAVPARFVRDFDWWLLTQMSIASVLLLALGLWVFYRGLRRYESGSAIQVGA